MVVQFFVTGFGPFSGVVHNPTQDLIELLDKDKAAEATGAGRPDFSILGTAVLEVAAQPVREWLSQLYSSAELAAAAAQEPVAVVHLGVDAQGRQFKLEQQAVNDASFRCPDQRGWRPAGVPIDDHPGCTLHTRLLTDLPVAEMADQLAERQRHDVCVSLDAGRFVCNYTYYLSLLHTQKARQRRGARLHALFVHIPPLAVFPLQQQYAFLRDALAAIAAALAPEAVPPPAPALVQALAIASGNAAPSAAAEDEDELAVSAAAVVAASTDGVGPVRGGALVAAAAAQRVAVAAGCRSS